MQQAASLPQPQLLVGVVPENKNQTESAGGPTGMGEGAQFKQTTDLERRLWAAEGNILTWKEKAAGAKCEV